MLRFLVGWVYLFRQFVSCSIALYLHSMTKLLSIAAILLFSCAAGPDRAARKNSQFGYVAVHKLDVETAVNEGVAAKLKARSVLSLPAVRFVIVEARYTNVGWGDLSSEGYPIYKWAFRHGDDSRSLRPPDYILRHEIGHDLFVRYLVPSTRGGQYGGDAPDWLDEMAAVAFEGTAQRKDRRRAAAMFARTSTLIPLARFLTMTHPELSGSLPPVSPEETFRVTQSSSEDTLRFYSTVQAFYDFLVIRTKSTAIVAELAAAFHRKEPLDRWLLNRAGFVNREDNLDKLNDDFLTWIASDERYILDR